MEFVQLKKLNVHVVYCILYVFLVWFVFKCVFFSFFFFCVYISVNKHVYITVCSVS